MLNMGDKPAKEWHNMPIEAPSVMISSKQITITPIIDGGDMTFLDSTSIRIYSIESGASIHFTLDGSEPDENSSEYISPFIIDSTTVIKSIAYLENRFPSKIVQANFIKIPYGRKIELNFYVRCQVRICFSTLNPGFQINK